MDATESLVQPAATHARDRAAAPGRADAPGERRAQDPLRVAGLLGTTISERTDGWSDRMTPLRFYGEPPPGIADRRSSRAADRDRGHRRRRALDAVALLKEWLEARGYAVVNTGLRRSQLAGRGIERAKRGNTLDPLTLNLLYATDFWDRMERQILPACARAWWRWSIATSSLMARARVRGVTAAWVEDLFGFALVPDLVVYLDIDVEHLVPRVLTSTGFDYWESGQDFLPGHDLYKNFIKYQSRLLPEFHDLAAKHDFKVINARRGVLDIFADLKAGIGDVVEGMMNDEPAPIVEGTDEPQMVREIMAKPTTAAPWE